jgi:LytTr DNA-binding domain
MMPDESGPTPAPFAATLLALAIAVPGALGVYPISLALSGLGYTPAAWVAACWQLASMVAWAVLSIGLLALLRRRTDANAATGEPALSLSTDGPAIAPVLVLSVAAHALTIASASEIMVLGRGRPPFWHLVLDVLLLYAPLNTMTILGLFAAAIVGAEHRGRLGEISRREELQRQLDGARQQVLTALAELNGAAATPASEASAHPLDRIPVTIGNRTIVIEADAVDFIEASSYYARLHAGSQQYLVRHSMNSLEARLDPRKFARIHRSTIVNLDRIAEMRPYDRRSYIVLLKDGRRLLMSRRRRQLLDYLFP